LYSLDYKTDLHALATFDRNNATLSKIYRGLGCQQHLVQDHTGRFNEAPCVPGLTPLGFQRWMTVAIRAHPTEEYERIQKALVAFPICNADDKSERFPKQVNRKLFPRDPDVDHRSLLREAITMDDEPEPTKPIENDSSNYPNSTSRNSAYSYPGPPKENKRSSVSFDDHKETPAIKIERERKPYGGPSTAQKEYVGNTETVSDTGASSRPSKPSRQDSAAKRAGDSRSDTGTGAYTGAHHRAESLNEKSRPPRPRDSRRSSPPRNRKPGDPYRHSDNDLSAYADENPLVDDLDPRVRYMRDAEAQRAEFTRRAAEAEAQQRRKYEGLSRDSRDEEYYRPSGGRGAGSGYSSDYPSSSYY
jgi:hypothetical protein